MHTSSVVSRALRQCLFAVVAVSMVASQAMAAERPIRLRARTFVPSSNVIAGAARSAARSIQRSSGTRHYLLQFEDRVTPAVLDLLRAAGVVPLRVVPEQAIAVAAPEDFDPSRIPGARWIGTLDPDDKLSAESRADVRSSFARYPFTVVEFHPDTSAASALSLALEAGATPVSVSGLPAHMLVIQTDRAAILALAQLDAVAWMFPASRELMSGRPAAMCVGLVSDSGTVASYATEGEGWDGPGRKSVRLSYLLTAASPDLPRALQSAELVRAMNEWGRYVAIDWVPASRAGAPLSVDFLWGPTNHGDAFPFPPNVIAHAFYPAPPSTEPLAGDVHFNDEFLWGASNPGAYDVFSVALHELGHALGLNHSSDPNSVMYPSYQGVVAGLSASDIQTVRMLYATRDDSGLPSQWTSGDVGTVATPGSVSFSNNTIVIKDAGADIWDVADEFTYSSELLAGDGDIIARLDSLQHVNRWTKAGVMIRDGRGPSAAHAFMFVAGERGLAFQRRRGSGQISVGTDPVPGSAPKWLRLSRRGDRFEAYAGEDGLTWRLIGVDTIPMSETVDAGLALTSHDASAVATAVFSNVAVTVVPKWTARDIGATGLTGSQTVGADRIAITAAGPDIWASADAFRFVWRPLSGDGEIVARVASLDYVRAWTKAGVMIRASRDPGSAHAFALVSAARGVAFQRRLTNGGASASTTGGASTAPVWLRLVRTGDIFSAYVSSDGQTWHLIGSEMVVMGRDVLAGLAVSSHSETARCRAVFGNVQVR